MNNNDIDETIKELGSRYNATEDNKKNELHSKLLEDYKIALEEIARLKEQLASSSKSELPSKDEVDTMASMIDLLSKLDNDVIDKIGKLGGKS